jgi:hypothetical protein
MQNMNRRFMTIGLFAIAIVAIAVLITNQDNGASKAIIDSEEKAIAYAKTDPDVDAFANKWENGVTFWAYKNDSSWKVEIVPVGTADIAFGILFNQDRTIISKGLEGGM